MLTLIDTYEKMAAIIPDYTFGGTKTPLIKMSISSSETEDEKKKLTTKTPRRNIVTKEALAKLIASAKIFF